VRSASDELAQTINAFEEYLGNKSIEVSAWVRVKGWEDARGEFWSREVGYDRFGNFWHIAIRETHGHESLPEDTSTYTWKFNSSPRKSRISASDKLPELLRELIKEAARTARRLREKTAEVNAFAATLNIKAPTKKAK
jgi:hypothetical protein